MRNILDIYKKYKIIKNLQEHMLRVAAVAVLICDSMTTEVDKENIVLGALFHDMGNIIKFDNDSLPEFYEPEGLEYWLKVKNDFIAKYGADEHEGNLKIMQEIGLPDKVVSLASQNKFKMLCIHANSSDMDIKIIHYADGRVAPYGVLSYKARMDEAGKRYGERKGENRWLGNDTERLKLVECGLEIEKQIFAHCKIKPEDITDEAVAPIVEQLRSFMIK